MKKPPDTGALRKK